MQALSIKHLVLGCLEGVFALGQVYVLFSRVTDPLHLALVGRHYDVCSMSHPRSHDAPAVFYVHIIVRGLPPADLLEEVAAAWEAEKIWLSHLHSHHKS